MFRRVLFRSDPLNEFWKYISLSLEVESKTIDVTKVYIHKNYGNILLELMKKDNSQKKNIQKNKASLEWLSYGPAETLDEEVNPYYIYIEDDFLI